MSLLHSSSAQAKLSAQTVKTKNKKLSGSSTKQSTSMCEAKLKALPSPVVPEACILYSIKVRCANCQILPWEKLYQTGYIFFAIIQAEFWMLYFAQSEVSEDWSHFLKAVVKKKNQISFQDFHTMSWVCLRNTSEKSKRGKTRLHFRSAQRETLLWIHWFVFSQYFATQVLMYILSNVHFVKH